MMGHAGLVHESTALALRASNQFILRQLNLHLLFAVFAFLANVVSALLGVARPDFHLARYLDDDVVIPLAVESDQVRNKNIVPIKRDEFAMPAHHFPLFGDERVEMYWRARPRDYAELSFVFAHPDALALAWLASDLAIRRVDVRAQQHLHDEGVEYLTGVFTVGIKGLVKSLEVFGARLPRAQVWRAVLVDLRCVLAQVDTATEQPARETLVQTILDDRQHDLRLRPVQQQLLVHPGI
mmetsp:Transcript_47174/g.131694  ORF Transcript_47174/g.131694 Transcript_47174/m.131694 type:complete len:239 (-) Transcript_47174:655-1371(-)